MWVCMKNILLGMLAVVLVTSTLFAGTARAALTANGISLNGLSSFNGISINGLSSFNGISLNGLSSFNGISINGLSSFNGFSMNGLTSVNGWAMNGLSTSNGLTTGNDLRQSIDRRAARAAIWTANGIELGKPLAQVGQN